MSTVSVHRGLTLSVNISTVLARNVYTGDSHYLWTHPQCGHGKCTPGTHTICEHIHSAGTGSVHRGLTLSVNTSTVRARKVYTGDSHYLWTHPQCGHGKCTPGTHTICEHIHSAGTGSVYRGLTLSVNTSTVRAREVYTGDSHYLWTHPQCGHGKCTPGTHTICEHIHSAGTESVHRGLTLSVNTSTVRAREVYTGDSHYLWTHPQCGHGKCTPGTHTICEHIHSAGTESVHWGLTLSVNTSTVQAREVYTGD